MTLASNIVMNITLYIVCNSFIIIQILCGLSESSKKTLFKDFILVVIKFKVTGKSKNSEFPRLWPQISLNKVIL